MSSLMLVTRTVITLKEPMTDSIFPEIDDLLNVGDYMEALQFIADSATMDTYHSTVDFLFCELHPEWKPSCRKFYDGKGKPLRDQISDYRRERSEKYMRIALDIAVNQLNKNRQISWGWYRKKVAQQFAQAA